MNMQNSAAVTFKALTPEELVQDYSWWKIYEDSFPVNEREPREVILHSVEFNVGVAVGASSNGQTIGLATTHLLKEPPAVFLVYLALASNWRSHGIGADLLEFAWGTSEAKLAQQGLKARGLIWEVKSTTQECQGEELLNGHRRVSFFRRCGGETLPGLYLQPPVDGIAPVPMDLMFRPSAQLKTPEPGEIDRLVRAMYFEKYGFINGIPRALLKALLAQRERSGEQSQPMKPGV